VTERRSRGGSDLVKVMFQLEPGAWHGSATETLWAARMGPGQYRLENSPFFAFGVSYQDVVAAREDGGHLRFTEVVRRAGRSTYRIIRKSGAEDAFERLWKPLEGAGCTYEKGPNQLLAVDVPPSSNIASVYQLLEAGEAAGAWSFEEGHCGHPVA